MAFLLKVLEPSQIVSPAGDQVSTHRSRTFHIQTTTDLFFSSLQIQRFSFYLNNSRQESCGCHHTQGSVIVFVEGRERKVILDESSHDQVAIVERSLLQNVDHQSAHKEEGACEGSVGNRLQAQKKLNHYYCCCLITHPGEGGESRDENWGFTGLVVQEFHLFVTWS